MPLTQVQGGMILPSTTLTTPIVATTMGVGGATPAASGAGITFPATQSASSNANTLDDYEEGTWTPTVVGVTSYSQQNATYIKIGKYVHVYGEVTCVDPGTLSAFDVASLPFTIQASPIAYPVGNFFPVVGFSSNATSLVFQGSAANTTTRLYWISNGTTNYNNITSSDLQNTIVFEFSLSYIASA